MNSTFEYRDGCIFRNGARSGFKRKKDGYRQIKFKGVAYLEHHIVWFLHHGYLPKYLDHKNRVRDDNRIDNLREFTHLENMQNKSDYSNNTSGHRNIFYKEKFGIYEVYGPRVNGKRPYLGSRRTLEEAVQLKGSLMCTTIEHNKLED